MTQSKSLDLPKSWRNTKVETPKYRDFHQSNKSFCFFAGFEQLYSSIGPLVMIGQISNQYSGLTIIVAYVTGYTENI